VFAYVFYNFILHTFYFT